jgi:hypothetical protein
VPNTHKALVSSSARGVGWGWKREREEKEGGREKEGRKEIYLCN